MGIFDFWSNRDENSTNENLDDLPSFDDDFDFDSFGDIETDDKRSPAKKFKDSFKEGVKTSLSNQELKNLIKQSVPNSYSDAVSAANDIEDSYDKLVDDISKTIKPQISGLKELTQHILKANKGLIPEKIHEKLDELTRSTSQNYTQMESKDAERNRQLSEIFGVQQEASKRAEARETIRDQVDYKKHTQTLSQLDAIRLGVMRMSDYNDNINLKYQRKSLELQFRSTEALVELLKYSKEQGKVNSQLLANIQKNTGLPDYVKLKTTEDFQYALRQRVYQAATDSLFSNKNYLGRLLKQAREGLTGFTTNAVNAFGMAISGANTAAEMTEMMGGGGLGNMLGSLAGDKINEQVTGRIKRFLGGESTLFGKRFKYADQLNKQGGNLSLILQNLEHDSNGALAKLRDRYLNSNFGLKNTGTLKGNIVSSFFDSIENLLDSAASKGRGPQVTAGLSGLANGPAIFNNQVSNSITDVIPGYLSYILRELSTIRSGKEAPLLRWDYTKNTLGTTGQIKNSIASSIFNDNQIKSVSSIAHYIGRNFDANQQLTNDDYASIAKIVNLASRDRKIRLDKNYFTNPANFTALGSAKAKIVADGFKEYLSDDKNNQKLIHLIKQYKNISSMGGSTAFNTINDFNQAGQGDLLREMGLIDKDGYINNNQLLDDLFNRERTNYAQSNQYDFTQTSGTLQSGIKVSNNTTNPQTSNQGNLPFVRSIDKNIETLLGVQQSISERTNEITHGVLTMSSLIENMASAQAEASGAPKPQRSHPILRFLSGTSKSIINAYGKIGGATIKAYGNILGGGFRLGASGINALFGGRGGNAKQADVYVKGEESPRITAIGLRNGLYFNRDGKVIRKLKDIKGDILDKEGNVVLAASEFKDAITDLSTGRGRGLLSILGTSAVGLGKAYGYAIGGMANFYGIALNTGIQASIAALKLTTRTAKSAYNNLVGTNSNKPSDVYIKGQKEPVLYRSKMLAGKYYNVSDGSLISKVNDIKSAVAEIDDAGEPQIVLSLEEARNGIYDPMGHSFNGIIPRLFRGSIGLAKKGVHLAVNASKFAYNTVTSIVRKGLGTVFNRDGFGFNFTSKSYMKEATKTNALLSSIYQLLNNRLPGKKLLGDMDGDGDVENSVADILQKRKAKKSADAEAALLKSSGASTAAGSILGAGLLKKLLSNKKDGDSIGAAEGILGWLGLKKAGGFARRLLSKVPGAKYLSKIPLLGRAFRAAPVAAKGGGLLAGTLGAAKGLAKFGVGKLAVPVGVGLSAYGLGKSIKNGNTDGIIDNGASLTGTAIGAGIGTLFGGVGAIPGAMIGGLVGTGVGKLTNLFRHRVTSKLKDMDTIRFIQYGFDPAKDKDLVKNVKRLEMLIYDNLAKSGDTYAPRPTRDFGEAVVKLTGITHASSPEEIGKLQAFVTDRMMPIVAAHKKVIESINPNNKLEDENKYELKDKIKILTAILNIDPSVYNVLGNPFTGHGALAYTGNKVVNYLSNTLKTMKQRFVEKGMKDKNGFFNTPWFESKAAKAARINKEKTELNKQLKDIENEGNALGGNKSNRPKPSSNVSKASTAAGVAISGVTTEKVVNKLDIAHGNTDGSHLDAGTSIRLKVYGLFNLELPKVNDLLQVEKLIEDKVFVNKSTNEATFDGTISAIGLLVSKFTMPVSVDDTIDWIRNRFLPTYLKFRSMMNYFGIHSNFATAVQSLSDKQKLVMAKHLLNTNVPNTDKSVFDVSSSPWSNYVLSKNARCCDGNLKYLENKIKNTVNEQTSDTNVSASSSQNGTQSNQASNTSDHKEGFFKHSWNKVKSFFGGSNNSTSPNNANSEKVTSSSTNGTGGSYGPDGKLITNYPVMPDSDSGNYTDTITGDVAANLPISGMLMKLGVNKETAEKWGPSLTRAMKKFGITSPNNVAAFLANITHESGNLKHFRENLNYSAATLARLWPHRYASNGAPNALARAIAGKPVLVGNNVYAKRMGNGPAPTGDGYNYRGRGPIQITGKGMYKQISDGIGVDLVSNPDLLTRPDVGAMASAYFWAKVKGINKYADVGDITKARRLVNGGDNGMKDVMNRYASLRRQLGNGSSLSLGDIPDQPLNATGDSNQMVASNDTGDTSGGADTAALASNTSPSNNPVSATDSNPTVNNPVNNSVGNSAVADVAMGAGASTPSNNNAGGLMNTAYTPGNGSSVSTPEATAAMAANRTQSAGNYTNSLEKLMTKQVSISSEQLAVLKQLAIALSPAGLNNGVNTSPGHSTGNNMQFTKAPDAPVKVSVV